MGIDVEAWYRKYGPMVLRRCRFILKDEDRALDAMQEVFVKLLRNRDRLKDTYPSSLLYRMATNVCLNMIRSEKRRPETGSDQVLQLLAHMDESEERVAMRDLLDRIFSREPASTREIAVLHYVDGMTYQEVAAEVGLSVSGVRKRLRVLKEKVQQMEVLEDG
mgnify:CR=1 FL=1